MKDIIYAKLNGKYGFINKRTGEVVAPFLYENASDFLGESMCVKKGGKWGLAKLNREKLSKFEYDYLHYVGEGMLEYQIAHKCGYMDSRGQVLTPCIYTPVEETFENGVLIARIGQKYGAIDKQAKEVLSFEFKRVEICEKLGREDDYGEAPKEPNAPWLESYELAGKYHEGFVKARKDGKWGFLDASGKVTVPFIYKADKKNRCPLDGFFGGLSLARKNGKVGVIDARGQIVIPFDYDYLEQFEDGLAAACKDDKWGYIDRVDNEPTPCIYEDVERRDWIEAFYNDGDYCDELYFD